MYKISESDFEKLNESMRAEMTRLLRRHVIITKDETVKPAASVPEKRGRPKKVVDPVNIPGQKNTKIRKSNKK
jgi:hypothetical protein